MAVVNPVTVGAAVRTVGAAWNIITSGGLSKKERAAIEAARDQGYTTGARGYRDPSGRVVSQADVISAGKRPADPGYRPDLTEKRIPPLVRTPPPKAPRVPKIPGRFGRIIEGIATVGGGILGSEAILRNIPQPTPTPPAPPAASPNEVIGGRSPFYASPGIKSFPGPTVALPPAAPLPVPLPAPAPSVPGILVDDGADMPIDTDRLGPISVYTPYAAIPAPPAPSGSPAAAPRTVLGMSPAQLAGIGIPLLLTLLNSSSSRRRRRDPLTPPGYPDVLGNIPGLGLTPTTPGGLPLPGGGGSLSFGSWSSSTDQCSCPPKRKRPKSKRTVCYSGTFSERASGLSKTRKRKIPCR